MDVTTVAAGLLHDVLEDTATSKAVLVERFGGDIAELVDGVTKIGKLAFATREERQAENFRKMLVAMARDIRVLMIKLADRLDNMRTLHYLPPEKQERSAGRPWTSTRRSRTGWASRGSRASSRTSRSSPSSPRSTTTSSAGWPSAASSARRTSTRS